MAGIDARAVALLQALSSADGDSDPPLITAAVAGKKGATLASVFAQADGASRNEKDAPTDARRRRFAGLVVGAVGEDEFQSRYAETMKGQEFAFADHTKEGTDTDFLILDARERPAFRINIKVHGTFFEKAKTFVGLEPEDTFALATYKVRAAVRKSQTEALPFLFAIVSSEKLRADAVGQALPPEVGLLADTSMLYRGLTGWKTIEDRLVAHLLDPNGHGKTPLITQLRKAASEAEWRVISAVKANHLMNELLDERVPAVSNPQFKVAPGSQPNMHFSLSQDMAGLDELLLQLRDHGIQHIATKIAYHEISFVGGEI